MTDTDGKKSQLNLFDHKKKKRISPSITSWGEFLEPIVKET